MSTTRTITWTGLERELMAMLEETRDRFHACLIHSGTDREFADVAVDRIDALLAYAKEYGGPNTSATVTR